MLAKELAEILLKDPAVVVLVQDVEYGIGDLLINFETTIHMACISNGEVRELEYQSSFSDEMISSMKARVAAFDESSLAAEHAEMCDEGAKSAAKCREDGDETSALVWDTMYGTLESHVKIMTESHETDLLLLQRVENGDYKFIIRIA